MIIGNGGIMSRIKKSYGAKRNTIWKIAVYIRLSRDDGNNESLSVINQKK